MPLTVPELQVYTTGRYSGWPALRLGITRRSGSWLASRLPSGHISRPDYEVDFQHIYLSLSWRLDTKTMAVEEAKLLKVDRVGTCEMGL